MAEAGAMQSVTGAESLREWFGYWPDFHDAEILRVELDRKTGGRIVVHIWDTTREVDGRGFYVTRKHALVEFMLEEIFDLELVQFSEQNVVGGIAIEAIDGGLRWKASPIYGLAGYVDAKSISVVLRPADPDGAVRI
jgi:immunity protein 50 of polymorphic toxin system